MARPSPPFWLIAGVGALGLLGVIASALSRENEDEDDGGENDEGVQLPKPDKLPRVKWSAESHRGVRMGKYFDLWEFTHQGEKHGIRNEPDGEQLVHGREFVREVLDPLRADLGRPVTISSGFRSYELNDATPNSASGSQHTLFRAADIEVEGFTSRQLARRIISLGLPYDQLIFYDPPRGGHVHVSYDPVRRRRDVRYARAGSKAYIPVSASTV